MIAKLKGLLDYKDTDNIIVDVNGVGYLVWCSAKTLASLPAAGEPVTLYVETQVREDAITLYGFESAAQKQWFTTLTKVQGVGAKVGLAIQSVLSASEISNALAAADKVPFTRASGVGPKLAARIVSELKDKAATVLSATTTAQAAAAGAGGAIATGDGSPKAIEDALSALVNLGYQRMEAFAAVGRVAQQLGETATVEQLISGALREFARKEGA